MTPQLKRYHRIARRNIAAGLTAHGTPKVRRFLTEHKRKASKRQFFHRRADARVSDGLTTRGTLRRTWNGRKSQRTVCPEMVDRAVKKSERMKAEINQRILQ